MNLLIVEDTPSLRMSLDRHLRGQGHTVDLAADLGTALSLWRSEPDRFDVILLDENLPDGLGSTLLAEVRAAGNDTGVLVLTARSQVHDKVHLLDVGADDYMTKPFEFPELDARIRSIHRRRQQKPSGLETFGPLEFDRSQSIFWAAGEQVQLRHKEAQLLEAFVDAKGAICTKARLIQKLYRLDDEVSENAVEVHVGRLRRRLADHNIRIETIRGVGYQCHV